MNSYGAYTKKLVEKVAQGAIFAVFIAAFYFLRSSIVKLFREHLIWVLVGVCVLIVLLLIYLLVFVRRARKKPAPEAAAAAAQPETEEDAKQAEVAAAPETAALMAQENLSRLRLRKIFSRAERFMKTNVFGRGDRYQIPMALMLGEAGSGKTRTLTEGGLKLPLGGPLGGRPGERHEVKFWFLEKGIVLDVAGDLVLRADGHSSDEKIWALLLRLLQKYRPERPADSLVLTLSAADLACGQNGEFDSDTVARKADLLSKKLRHAQKVLGIRFPVYILVTQCDRIEGFQAYCRSLPEERTGDLFGWSNPHTIDTGYAGEWVGRAFDSIDKDVFLTQMEMLSEGVRPDEGDGVFLMRENLRRLQSPLQIYLDRIFFDSVYHDAYVFRGIYFCGSSGIEAIKNVGERVFFVRDLFNRKVFSEFHLARPLVRTLVSRNRKVLAAQVAALVLTISGALGLWRTHVRLDDDRRAMLPVFEQLNADIKRLGQTGSAADGLQLFQALRQGPVSISFDKSAMNLFRGMTNFRQLRYVTIPSSWFSDIHDRLRQAMVEAYDEIILKAMYIQLVQKAKTIFDTAGKDLPPMDLRAEVRAVSDQPEFEELKAFVSQLQELETHAELYNGLRTTQNLEDIGKVVKYLFDMELPKAFYRNAQYYHVAIGKAEYRVFDPSIFQLKARFFTVRKLTRGLYARLFSHNAVEVQLQRLSKQLEALGRQRRKPRREMRLIRAVLEAINETEALLTREEAAWMFKSGFDLGSGYGEILDGIEASSFLGEEPKTEALNAGETELKALQASLRAKRSLLTGPLLAVAGEMTEAEGGPDWAAEPEGPGEPDSTDNAAFFADFQGEGILDIEEPDAPLDGASEEPVSEKLAQTDESAGEDQAEAPAPDALANRLSPRVMALKQELEALVGQRFMSDEGLVMPDLQMPPGTRLRWNRDLVVEAVTLFEPYAIYQQEGLQKFPADLQNSMAALARQNIENKVLDLIGRAQSFEPLPVDFEGELKEADLLVELRDFSKSSSILERLLFECDRFDLVQARQKLSDLLYWQTATLLESFDRLHAEENLYGVREGNLNWWDGRSPLAFDAFEVEDEKELKNYLRFQRVRINHMAQTYAQPLVAFLQSTQLLRHRQEERVLFKWQRVLTELEKFAAKKPDNSLTALEQFILSDLNKIRPENYYEAVGPEDLDVRSGDIFIERRNALRRMAYRRCQVLAAMEIETAYASIADYFNKRLSGRFPFADAGQTSFLVEAQPEDIRDFFRLYDRHGAKLVDVLKSNDRFGVSGDRALEFLTRAGEIQHFLAPYLGAAAGPGPEAKAQAPSVETPTYDLAVEFRVNSKREAMANRIIGWYLSVGDRTVSQPGAVHTLRWQYGDPIVLMLRWAKNAPDFPAYAGDRPEAAIDGRSIVYRFQNRWSLLRLLRDYAGVPGDFEKREDPKPHTLRFAVDTRRAGVRPEDGGQFETRAYVRIGLMSPDKAKTELVVPVFPGAAPTLKRVADTKP